MMDDKVLRIDENYTDVLSDRLVLNESPLRYLNQIFFRERTLILGGGGGLQPRRGGSH